MRRRLGCAAALVLVGLLLSGCASSGPTPKLDTHVHVVDRGDTLWSISQSYGTSVQAIVDTNRLRDASQISIGQRLLIPPRTRANHRPRPERWSRSDKRGRSRATRLAWPLQGRVTSGFGMRGGAHHDGLDIPAPAGTAILAAEAGRIVHSDDSLAGYGNMVIIKHKGRLSSVYAHNRRNRVRLGEFVEKGQVIAEVGRTGRTTAAHLHFEVRYDGKPHNPLEYLP